MRAGLIASALLAFVLVALTLCGTPSPGGAQEATAPDPGDFEQSKQYAACMLLARDHPQDAYDSSGTWLTQGGGVPARHCRAVALIGLGRFAEAADLLTATANELAATDIRKPLLADLYGQAAQAWLMAGDGGRAIEAENAAISLAPDDVELRIDRAIVLVGVEKYWEAIDDLNHAGELAPDRADILVLRASAYRYVESPDLALEDVTRALALDAGNAEAYLERGILEAMANDRDNARADFLQAITLEPDSPTAEAAQARLQRLDLPAQ